MHRRDRLHYHLVQFYSSLYDSKKLLVCFMTAEHPPTETPYLIKEVAELPYGGVAGSLGSEAPRLLGREASR